jgi:hypothetical protein
MRRRRYLAALSSASALAVAGCFGSSDTDSPRSVVTAYIEAEQEGDADALADLLHSGSPIEPAGESGEQNRSVDVQEVVVAERNLSAERLRSLEMQLPADAATAVGNAENALVDATYEIDAPAVEDGGTTSDRLTVENAYLTAREDGDWLVVAFTLR